MLPTFYKGIALLVPFYLWYVRTQRWKHYEKIHKKYQKKYEDKTLTPEEAQEVFYVFGFLDMPMLYNYSLAFALFKTYAIPTISKLLATTGELSASDRVSKRYADTEVMIATWLMHPISGFKGCKGPPTPGAEADPRAMIALARTNWLHSRYRISNDDFIYTLCLFIQEPIVWAERYGWRELSDLEKYAYYIFWAEIGRRMGFHDIPESFEKVLAWSEEYEQRAMFPAEINRDVANYTTDELIYAVPEIFGLKSFARSITTCLLSDRVRVAMMQPKQPRYKHMIVYYSLNAINWFQRWFCLPRTEAKTVTATRDPKIIPGQCPRLRPVRYQARPWYKPEGAGLQYIIDRLAVFIGYYADMPGPHFRSQGYRLEEMGPLRYEQSAHEEIMRNAAELQGYPITGPWSLNWNSK